LALRTEEDVVSLTSLFLALTTNAQAGSLDLLEVGGMWGTPAATNPTAVWWNPAGLAVASGTQILIESAPTFARAQHERTSPDYGPIDEENAVDLDGDGFPDTKYDYGGPDELKYSGFSPFAGVSTDFGVKGFGIGAAFFVPFAKEGESSYPNGSGRYNVRGGGNKALYLSLASGYHIADLVAIGASFSYVMNTWEADVDTEAYSALGPAYAEALSTDIPETYQDGYIEHPGYTTNLKFDPLKDNTVTFGTGVYITPIDMLGISIAYHHGIRVENTGDVTLGFSCPPTDDFPSAAAAGLTGLCTDQKGATIKGTSLIAYNLPSRLHGGILLEPVDMLRLELMGGWVHWSQFTDYEIHTKVKPSDVPVDSEEFQQTTADLVSQDRLWARASKNNGWVGLDGKVSPIPVLTLGGRAMVDTPAVPSMAVSTNNFDSLSVILSGLVVVKPVKMLDIGLSYGHHFVTKRTITDSGFGVTLDESKRKADRFFYPEANGTYVGHINRLGISVRGHFFEKEE
jgi:long-subunit fatty acid transport protein